MKKCAHQSASNKYYLIDRLSNAQVEAIEYIGKYGDGDLVYPQTIAKLIRLNYIIEVNKNDYELTSLGANAYKQALDKANSNATGQN